MTPTLVTVPVMAREKIKALPPMGGERIKDTKRVLYAKEFTFQGQWTSKYGSQQQGTLLKKILLSE